MEINSNEKIILYFVQIRLISTIMSVYIFFFFHREETLPHIHKYTNTKIANVDFEILM